MRTVFLSHATIDHHFAELASIKLAEAGIHLWRDRGELRAGTDWRQGIERGISESVAVVVALSPTSSISPYVTFEWAYALGQAKPVLPLKLAECSVHPRLETIQSIDFSIPGSLPWTALVERITEIEPAAESDTASARRAVNVDDAWIEVPYVSEILAYLNQRGYQMVSFDRIRRRIDENLSDQKLRQLIDENPTVFRHATLTEGRPGLAVRQP